MVLLASCFLLVLLLMQHQQHHQHCCSTISKMMSRKETTAPPIVLSWCLVLLPCWKMFGMQDEMLPAEHMQRMQQLLVRQQGRVSWLPVHAGHMDAYEVAAQVTHLMPVLLHSGISHGQLHAYGCLYPSCCLCAHLQYMPNKL